MRFLKVQVNGPFTLERREQTGVLEKNPDNQSENRCPMLEVKIHSPNWGSNCRPLKSNIGDKFAFSECANPNPLNYCLPVLACDCTQL